MKKQKGFTLIEILIIVVILAVLAAMILPRFLSQTENAYVAEAQQVLGILRRAQVTQADMGVTIPALAAADTKLDASIAPLGLKGISDTNFTYSCLAAGASCTATRQGSGTTAGGTITLAIDGTWTCDGTKYTAVSGNKGCKPAV